MATDFTVSDSNEEHLQQTSDFCFVLFMKFATPGSAQPLATPGALPLIGKTMLFLQAKDVKDVGKATDSYWFIVT